MHPKFYITKKCLKNILIEKKEETKIWFITNKSNNMKKNQSDSIPYLQSS